MRIFLPLLLACAGAAWAQESRGYVFAAPTINKTALGSSYFDALHYGGGVEVACPFCKIKGLGLGAEIGSFGQLKPYFRPFSQITRTGLFSLNGVYHIGSQDSRFMPFATAGYSGGFGSGYVNLSNFGGGVTYRLNPRLALRLEVRDFLIHRPAGFSHIIDLRTGLNIAFHRDGATAGPDGRLQACNIGPMEVPPGAIYPGDRVTLRVPASCATAGLTPAWTWIFQDATRMEAEGATLTVTAPDTPGRYPVKTQVAIHSSGKPRAPELREGDFTVSEWPAPVLTVSSGQSLLSGTLAPFERAREVVFQFKSSQDRLEPAAGVAANEVERPDARTLMVRKMVPAGQPATIVARFTAATALAKPVEVEVTVRDSRGRAAMSPIQVALAPAAAPVAPAASGPAASVALTSNAARLSSPQRLPDIIFAYGHDRVTACSRQVLDDVSAALGANSDLEVVLVGHIDGPEATLATARTRALDQRRTINVANSLTARERPCGAIDPARVKVAFAGASQANSHQPLLCMSSGQEARADRIPPNPRARHRRVEVWLVARGSQPPNVTARDLPAAALTPGCPLNPGHRMVSQVRR